MVRTDPIPKKSLALRDAEVERIKTAKELIEDKRARLLAYVARTAYLGEKKATGWPLADGFQ